MRRDRWIGAAWAVAAWGAAAVILAVFAWILGGILWKGLGLFHVDFLYTAPRLAGRAGGVGPILVSTFLILMTALAVSLPLGVGAAVVLSEQHAGRGPALWVRQSLDVLAGVPSIVFGLFGNALFCQVLGLGFSILSGGLTLACMVLPLLIRATEEGLRAVPADCRRASEALALSRLGTLRHLLLPAAAPAIVVGLTLGVGRAAAETAALIFTSGYVDRMPGSLLDSGRALSIHIYDLSMNVSGGDDNAYRSCLVLVASLLAINGAAGALTGRFLKKRSTVA